MIAAYDEVARRIDDELADLDRCAERVLRSWGLALRSSTDQDIYIDSVALNLHSFYTGLESLFEIVARQVDGDVPAGDMWHAELLQRMAEARDDIRPAVITQPTRDRLDEYRRFRHLVRHVYADRLDVTRLTGLTRDLADLRDRLTSELRRFATFLRDVSAADDVMP